MDRFRTALLAVVLLRQFAHRGDGQRQTREATVRGIAAALDIAIDHWGIPHISAGSVNDAFFGARLRRGNVRLWQLDILRRRQLGRLAGVFGPTFVPFRPAARSSSIAVRSTRSGRGWTPGSRELPAPSLPGSMRASRKCGTIAPFCRPSLLPSTCSPISGARKTWCGRVW